MEVYLVESVDFADGSHEVDGIFSTQQKAKEYISYCESNDDPDWPYYYRIESYIVDEGM